MTPGDLVISEIRGPQSKDDDFGQWIEIHNRSSSSVFLAGLIVNLRNLDGSGEENLVLRDYSIAVDGSGYFVFGQFYSNALPAHVDYGYADQFSSNLYSDGVLELHACQEMIDRVIYHNLPRQGTLSFDGDQELTAENNDQEIYWCSDQNPDPQGGDVDPVMPGTPGESNHPCN